MFKSDFMLSKSKAAQANHKRVCLDVDHQVNKADSYPKKKQKAGKAYEPKCPTKLIDDSVGHCPSCQVDSAQ